MADKSLLDYFPSLAQERLMCSTWFGYCATCQLHNCRDRAEEFGKPRQKPKHDPDYLCDGDVGDEGWGADW